MTKSDAAIRALEEELRRPGKLRAWLRTRRWCGESLGHTTEVSVKDRLVLSEGNEGAIAWFLVTAKEGTVTVPMNLLFLVNDRSSGADAFEFSIGDARWFAVEAERSESFARF